MIDNSYKEIIETVLKEGYWYDDPNRESVKRLEIPSYTFKHDFKNGFPAISTKKLAWKSVVTELLWFLKGDTNIKYLIDNGCNIWNKDAYNYFTNKCKEVNILEYSFEQFIENIKNNKEGSIHRRDYNLGDLGKVYGHYWRNFDGVDQIAELINDMINKPMSSELIVSARNPSHKGVQALPCCHYGFQVIMKPIEYSFENASDECLEHFDKEYLKYSSGDESDEDYWYAGWYKYAFEKYPQYGFELHWNQRSCDLFLGIPFNIASYALLALILEKITGHKALGIQGDLKKVHLYDNSIKAAEEQLSRKCSEEKVKLLIDSHSLETGTYINQIINNLMIGDFELENYNPQPAIKVEMLERR